MMEMIALIEDEAERAEAYLSNDLIDPSIAPTEEEAEKTTTTSRNKDLYERSVIELGKLYRALNSADNDAIIKGHAKSLELQAALLDITRGLKALGAPVEDEALVTFMKTVAKR